MRDLRKLARNRQLPLARYLDGLAIEFHRNFENWNYKLSANGEARVIEVLARENETRVVFDVGANHGSWSLLAAAKLSGSVVHAFELSPIVAESLQKKAANESRIVVNQCGLSDTEGEIEFLYAPGRDVLSSGVAITGSVVTEKARGRVLRGSDYCHEQGLPRIDFLKIDVEGMEDRVLRGFTEMLERHAIRVIQFEYGRVNIESHVLLKDFHALLAGYGYSVGKVYPKEVLFKDYDYDDENFLGPNYLAVLSSETALIDRLACDPAHRKATHP